MPIDLYDPKHFLAPSTLTLVDLLGGRFFHVPAYQRDYAWSGKEEVRLLWSDILATIERSWTESGMPVEHRRPHFFGPIVVQTRSETPSTVEVMDGQQRLVTFSILLSILAEQAATINDEEARTNWLGSLKQLLFVYSNGARRPRIKLGRSAEQFEELFCVRLTHAERMSFLKSVSDARPPELAAMIGCYEVLRERVTNYLGGGPDPEDRLVRLIRTVLGLSLFLLMEVQEHGVAYEVFEGLNARGLELSQADLVKNKLFELAHQQGTLIPVQQQWEAAFEAVRGQSMVQMPLFLQLHHSVFFGAVKATDLYDRVSTQTLPSTTATDYAASVRRAAERLQLTLDAGAAFSGPAIRHIERIRDSLNNRAGLLLVLASTDRVKIESIDYETVLKLGHHFVFRRFVIEETSLSTYFLELSEAARDFAHGGTVSGLAEKLQAKSTDEGFKARFEIASARTAKEGFYVCEMMEHLLGSDAGMLPNPQSPNQHLEHIFPKRPAAGVWEAITSEQLALVVNRLGNLLVLEGNINSSIKNKAYQTKKSNPSTRDYNHSGLRLPRSLEEFEDAGEWTRRSIDRRQSFLATEYATTVWSLLP